MKEKIKTWIQHKLNNICYSKYLQEVEIQKDSYRQWYEANESWKERDYRKVPRTAYGDGCLEPETEIVVFADEEGVREEKALGVVAEFFAENEFVQLAYGDEDCLDEEGRRIQPWFKPEWSPDTLDSFFYFGHFFAVRKNLLVQVEGWQEMDRYELARTLCRKITEKNWIPANREKKEIAPIGKVLIHMKGEKPDKERDSQPIQIEGTHKISVVIPSKDNPDVLKICISTMRDKTLLLPGTALEILVVDNGSNEKNKKIVEEMARVYTFSYLYVPMPFNFSRMCNLGAEKAQGDFLLFLNDDMEIIQPDWLMRLLEKAVLPHAGAVGAKLLYPDSDVIQHIGITNIKVGPVHKLLKQHDKKIYYHGQNRHIYDMIGVTAACLLIARDKFEQAGRLFEGMAVAYNDVDFCFTLYELGYYNIFRGDVTLYHHESLSRGDDNLSDEKWVRLLQEKDILYDRHPSLKQFDPFYSRNLAVHSNLYLSNFMYDYEKRDYYTGVKRFRGAEPVKWLNNCLTVNVEHARMEKKLEFTERDDVYWIEGWSYVLGMDNCRYERSLLLQGKKGNVYRLKVLSRYRKDVEDILPDEKNVALAGFVCRIPRGLLPEDTYRVSMIAKDRCSNQRLYARTEAEFEVTGEKGIT